MTDVAFLAMRADLVGRGLLTGDFRLTAAGNAHVDELLFRLPLQSPPPPPGGPGVRWNVKWRKAR